MDRVEQMAVSATTKEPKLEDWQLEMVGLIKGWGKVEMACEVAMDHAPEGVLYLFQLAYREGQLDTLKKVVSSVSRELG